MSSKASEDKTVADLVKRVTETLTERATAFKRYEM
jgi:hypothetical protein